MELTCETCKKTFKRRKTKSKLSFCCKKCYAEYLKDDYTLFRHMFVKAKHGAIRRNLSFDITIDDIKNLWESTEGRCVYTGEKLIIADTSYLKEHGHNTASLDRKNNDLGYSPDNIQFVHKYINDMKGYLSEEVFIDFCKKVANHLGPYGHPCATIDIDESSIPF